MSTLQNLQTTLDPFAANSSAAAPEGELGAGSQSTMKKTNEVHIRFQQRSGRKGVTTVQGLNQRLDFDKLNKEFKKRWGCAGTIIQDKEAGIVIQLQGDQRDHLKEFLVEEKLTKVEHLRLHGL